MKTWGDFKEFFMRLKIFLNDLMTFGSDSDTRERLEKYPLDNLYLSYIYFTESEIQYIRTFVGDNGLTLEQILHAKKQDFSLCASHDLAPIFSQQFGIKKDFRTEKCFIKAYKQFKKEWKKRV